MKIEVIIMQRKELVNTFRSQGKIKGGKPCVIYLKNNIGKIYNEGYGDFILSQKNNDLFFQKIGGFFVKKLVPKDDFKINISNLSEYALEQRVLENILCLYTKDKCFIEIHYNKGIPDTYQTEDNICRIIKITDFCILPNYISNNFYRNYKK